MREFIAPILLTLPAGLAAQIPVALADSDLAIHHVAFWQDSSSVRRLLGAPIQRDSSSWHYNGLRIWFEYAKVHQIEISSSQYATPRGLRVGDAVARATELYGPSCSAGVFVYCRTVGDEPDERGILLEVSNDRITVIRIGAVFDLD